MYVEAYKIKNNKNKAADIPAIRVLPPDLTLIIDCPIIAHPPIPPKKPVTVLAKPCAKHSWLAPPFLFVISPTKFRVRRLSIKPIEASIKAYGKIIFNVSIFKGTLGIEKSGSPPLTLARSPTLGMSMLKAKTRIVVNKIATSVDGSALVIFGNNHITSMVNKTNPIE